MKYYLFALFCTFGMTAQTAAERAKIAASYDKELQAELRREAQAEYKAQQAAIAAYKAQTGFVDSEKKKLHRIENGVPIFYTTFNQGSSLTINANKLYPGGALGLNVTGAGMVAGVWDSGKVRDTHIEFNGGKVVLGDASTTLSSHATHVTGTIIATGISSERRGIAYGAQARTHDWDDDYDEVLAFAGEGYLVSNHSYGYNTESLPVYKFGSYDVSSIEVDNISTANPYYQVVIAAGNDRNNFALDHVANLGGFDLLSGTATSKNGITVAAVEQVNNYLDPDSVIMSSFSNFGPTDDGRVKPDIAAKGVAVNSTVSSTNTSYDTYNGTSMAAPAITGLIVLLQKHYNNVNSSYMRASTVRGLICHSAREAGFYPGPDYEYGWGLADAAAAANIISNNTSALIEENTLTNGGTYTKPFAITTAQDLTATICWTDPAGSNNGTVEDNRAARLKNNLDLKVLKDGVTYYPWKLTPDDVYAPATNDSENDVDNVEKIQIPNAAPGVYTIQVTHKGTLSGNGNTQVYSLILSGTEGISLATNSAELNSGVIVYPNPVRNTLNIAVPNEAQLSNVALFDILGKEVRLNSQFVGNAIDVSTLPSGVYFAKFSVDGNPVVRKFVKE